MGEFHSDTAFNKGHPKLHSSGLLSAFGAIKVFYQLDMIPTCIIQNSHFYIPHCSWWHAECYTQRR